MSTVCLCGSSRWPEQHMRVMMEETLAGNIVIPMGLYGHADFPSGAKAATCDRNESTAVKQMLDKLHFEKIDLADEILVVRVGGYFGDSTRREIEYARKTGKTVRFYDCYEASSDSQKLERIRAAFEHARDQAIRSDVKSNPADFFNAVERILFEP